MLSVLDGVPQFAERIGPKVGHERADRVEPIRVNDVEVTAAVALHGHQPGVLEDLEVVRNRLLACLAALGDRPDRQRLVTDKLQDLLTLGSSERCEHFLGRHLTIVTAMALTHK